MYNSVFEAWASANNVLGTTNNSTPNNNNNNNNAGTDFRLHSSYNDFVNNANAWSYCNYDDNTGNIHIIATIISLVLSLHSL